MIDRRPWDSLASRLGDRLIFGAPLADLTRYGVGGSAALLARPESAEEVRDLLAVRNETGLPLSILGGGSNTLFTEAGFAGLVMRIGQGFQVVEALGDTGLRAGAGAHTAAVAEAAAERGLRGLEGLAGIPGRFGGALMMNAGSFGQDVGSCVERLFGLDAQGREFSLGKAELRYEYRRLSGLAEGAVLLGAELRLEAGHPEDIKRTVAENLARRSASQPKGFRSAGSVFKNPAGHSAGRLIEECGLKGATIGGAAVSEVHANFIVVQGKAESGHILELVDKIRAAVYNQRGVVLEPEIKIIGPTGPLTLASPGGGQ
ncbi:MAG: UDP-N-acetylmuramate dehydrogenase [Candidatus Adiutrix sp.]|nr:UDP-N-acetylmuramate dehydrogenase [Candidatus Adiutrix sp.]